MRYIRLSSDNFSQSNATIGILSSRGPSVLFSSTVRPSARSHVQVESERLWKREGLKASPIATKERTPAVE